MRPAFTRVLLFLLVLAVAGCTQRTPAAYVHSGPYEGTPLEGPAADFRLKDQRGAFVGLGDFRGKVVVLTFFDSQCREVCPLTAYHLRQSDHELGTQAPKVAFLAVNVNLEANAVEHVHWATLRWNLNEIPSFHFLTGEEEEMTAIWLAYGVTAYPAQDGSGELVHTPGVFLIDAAGEKRWYVSTAFDQASEVPLHALLVRHIRALLEEG